MEILLKTQSDDFSVKLPRRLAQPHPRMSNSSHIEQKFLNFSCCSASKLLLFELNIDSFEVERAFQVSIKVSETCSLSTNLISLRINQSTVESNKRKFKLLISTSAISGADKFQQLNRKMKNESRKGKIKIRSKRNVTAGLDVFAMRARFPLRFFWEIRERSSEFSFHLRVFLRRFLR